MSNTFSFQELPKPVVWTGRYNRIPGKEPTFKAKADGTLLAYWRPWPGDEWLTSPFMDCPAVQRLAAAVNRAKAANAGVPGGAFQINEFGQVICPTNNDREKVWVGTVGGVPRFRDPRDSSKPFELQEPVTSAAGEPWDRPYLGMKFNLDGNDSIYFQQDDGDTRTKLRLGGVDSNLVRRLRSVRGSASNIRFIVNLHGVALTKVEPDWRPVFVGHIDLAQWFPKLP
jgi:hypothetical protein